MKISICLVTLRPKHPCVDEVIFPFLVISWLCLRIVCVAPVVGISKLVKHIQLWPMSLNNNFLLMKLTNFCTSEIFDTGLYPWQNSDILVFVLTLSSVGYILRSLPTVIIVCKCDLSHVPMIRQYNLLIKYTEIFGKWDNMLISCSIHQSRLRPGRSSQ